ncbi:MAG TPA: N-acetyltransferase [Alphaproteobacteria bacterium]
MSDRADVAITDAAVPDDIEVVRALFLEYARSLNFSLCFQGFERELAELPGQYAAPRGCILLARRGGEAGGVVALRPLEPGICEMKRLYVRPAWRGLHIGDRLARRVIERARQLNYRAMRLDTHESMAAAIALYRGLGFREIPRYYDNPMDGILYFERRLDGCH